MNEIKQLYMVLCPECGIAFGAFTEWQKFCSRRCSAKQPRVKFSRDLFKKICPFCNKSFEAIHESAVCCSRSCARLRGRSV